MQLVVLRGPWKKFLRRQFAIGGLVAASVVIGQIAGRVAAGYGYDMTGCFLLTSAMTAAGLEKRAQ